MRAAAIGAKKAFPFAAPGNFCSAVRTREAGKGSYHRGILGELSENRGRVCRSLLSFEEPVCIVCNEEGKINGLPLNRAIYAEPDRGEMLDIIAGTFFICDCSGENFGSLSPEQLRRYTELFKYPEQFFRAGNDIKAVPYIPEKSGALRRGARGKCQRHFLSKHRALTAHWLVGVTPNPYYTRKGGSMARRNIKIDLRLSEQEMEAAAPDVARSGWSREKYLRALIEHSIIKEMPSMDLVAVLRNLQQINNNINQIALVANAKGFIDTAAYWENVNHLKKDDP